MDYTPTRWRVGRQVGVTDAVVYGPVTGAMPGTVASVADCNPIRNTSRRVQEATANARRIAACVNACEGIPTEELEQMYFMELHRAWQGYKERSAERPVL